MPEQQECAEQIETCTVEDGGPCGQPAIATAKRGIATAFVCARDYPAIEQQGYEMTPLPTLPDRDHVIEARVRAQVAEDLRIILDQSVTHSHERPGIWDSDNRPGLANTRCVECAARERVRAWLAQGTSHRAAH